MLPLFGYAIIVGRTRAFFAMEHCLTDRQPSAGDLAQLMQSLRAMHAIRFVHIDIKKSNIAFSPTFGKYVFIDFGLSELIRECQQ